MLPTTPEYETPRPMNVSREKKPTAHPGKDQADIKLSETAPKLLPACCTMYHKNLPHPYQLILDSSPSLHLPLNAHLLYLEDAQGP